MPVFFPNNIFTRVLTSCFTDNIKKEVTFIPSAQITQNILNDNSSVGLIPVMDLLRHKDLFVSSGYGISFEGSLCNSYIYYNQKENLKKISLAGDVSSQEVILSKILFKEMYSSDIEIEILTNLNKAEEKNVLITGDENFKDEKFKQGISFSEIMVDALSLPFVNYIFASPVEETLQNFERNLEGIDIHFYNKIEEKNFDAGLSPVSSEYIRENISSLIIRFDEQDREGVEQVLRLPYFYGIVKDITEVNFLKPSF